MERDFIRVAWHDQLVCTKVLGPRNRDAFYSYTVCIRTRIHRAKSMHFIGIAKIVYMSGYDDANDDGAQVR